MEMKNELDLLNQQAREEKKRGEMLIQLICEVNTIKTALLKQQSAYDEAERESKSLIRELTDLKAKKRIMKNNTEYLKELVIQQELQVVECKRELEQTRKELFNDVLEYVSRNVPKSEVDRGEDLERQLKENGDLRKEVDELKGRVEGLVMIAELTKKRYDRIVSFFNEQQGD